MPTASQRLGSSVTPGMGAKVAATKVATTGAGSRCVSLCSVAGSGAGVGGVGGDGSAGEDGRGANTISGSGNSGVDVTLLSTCGAVVCPSCGVRGLPCWAGVSVLAEQRGVEVAVTMVGEGVVVFKAEFWGVEAFPGAGADAVFRELIREVGILPPAGGGAGLECWVAPGFLPLNGAGGLFTELGLEVVVVLLEGKTAVFGVGAFVLVGGARGGSGFPLEGELGFFPTPTAGALVVAVAVAVVVTVAAAVAVAASTSSNSG